ncbi:kinase-like domain-containing protein, partial [Gorgonomyces haynaldii]
YKIIRQIGTGGHSTVKLALKNGTNQYVVCKYITASNVWHWTPDGVPLEIKMMQDFTKRGHPAFIEYIEHFELGPSYIIVMEYLGREWMDLYDYIEVFGPVREDHTREIFESVVDVVCYMHRLGYSHNDIKDENIMIHTQSRTIKLIDFGSTMRLQAKPVTVFYGTQKFACPEAVATKSYLLESQEVWALGTLLYVLLFKMDPFAGDNEIVDLDISKRIKRLTEGSETLPAIPISAAAQELLVALLQKNWRDRPEIGEIREFAFFHQ